MRLLTSKARSGSCSILANAFGAPAAVALVFVCLRSSLMR